jgi:murein L,D-transpeptidase YcbB/YkuD
MWLLSMTIVRVCYFGSKEKTENAITEFQRNHGLPANGIIDRNTWDALALSYNHISENELYSD